MSGHNYSQYHLNPLPDEAYPKDEAHLKDAIHPKDAIHSKPALSTDGGADSHPKSTAALMPGQVFCRFCGKCIFAEAILCAHCERQVKELQAPNSESKSHEVKRVRWHISEMILLILLTMLCPIVGYVYGYIGSKEPDRERQAKVLMVAASAFNILYVSLYFSAHRA